MSTDSSIRAVGSGEPAGNCVLRCQQALLTPPSRRYLQPLAIPMPSQKQSSSDVRRLQNPLRLRHAVALRVVDAEALQHVDDLLVLGELGNGLLAGQVPDFIDRTHHLAVDGIVQYLLDEAAVDLQVIDREVLEIAER